MPVEERRRIALHHHIAAAWGEEAADTLFDLVTPAGQDLVTRQDVVELRERTDHRFDLIDLRFAALEDRSDVRFAALEDRLDVRFAAMGERFERRLGEAVSTQTRTLVWSQLAALVTITALAFGLR